jgi:hypothetical protein
MHHHARTPRPWVLPHGLGLALLCLSASCGDSANNTEASAGTTSAAAGASTSTAGTGTGVAGSPATAGSTNAGSGGSAGGSGAGGQTTVPPVGGAPSAGAGGAAAGATSSAGTSAAGSNAGSTIVPDPSWACGKADGIVDPKLGELVFSVSVGVGQVREVGATQFGDRRVSDLASATISGNKLDATWLAGGLDFELELSTGAIELEQVAMLRGKDGSLVYLRTCGVAPAGESIVRFVPDFEAATASSLAWLNTGNFVGTRKLDVAGKKVELAVYDVSKVKTDGPKLQLKDPAGVANQPWDCVKASGTKSTEVFTETVTLGSSLSVGASKRGTRNVIPITGGTVTGKLTGTVVNAGADYQLVSGSTTLDARYVLASSDGETVVVRNCGPFGALIPLFETRSAGPYAFLNTGKFISSDPGSAAGGVKITFFELK